MGFFFYKKPLVVILLFYFFSLTSFANSKICAELLMDNKTSNHGPSTNQRSFSADKPADLSLLMATLQDTLLLKNMVARIREVHNNLINNPQNKYFQQQMKSETDLLFKFLKTDIEPIDPSSSPVRTHKTFWKRRSSAAQVFANRSVQIILLMDKDILPTIAYYDGREPHQSKDEGGHHLNAFNVTTIDGKMVELLEFQPVWSLTATGEQAQLVFNYIKNTLSSTEGILMNMGQIVPKQVARDIAIREGFVPISSIKINTIVDLYLELNKWIGGKIISEPSNYNGSESDLRLKVGTITNTRITIYDDLKGEQQITISLSIHDPIGGVYEKELHMYFENGALHHSRSSRGEAEALIYARNSISSDQDRVEKQIPDLTINNKISLAQELLSALAKAKSGPNGSGKNEKKRLTVGARIIFFQKHWNSPRDLFMSEGEVTEIKNGLFGNMSGPKEITIRLGPNGSHATKTILVKDIQFFEIISK